MVRKVINIPRTSCNLYAERVKKAFLDLGWTLEMTGYLLTGASQAWPNKVRTLVFQWTRPAPPQYPEKISA